MTIPVPVLDDRSFEQLIAEAVARIPVHTPEWTNRNDSDPGITIVQLFAFLTENLLYRSNRIPEANRLKFLSMLGISLRPASPGTGLVTFQNDRAPLTPPLDVPAATVVQAGKVPFVTRNELAVLPVTSAVYYKKPQTGLDDAKRQAYERLYQTFLGAPTDVLSFYQPVALDPPVTGKPDPVVDLGDSENGTIDRSVWVALLAPKGADMAAVRAAIANQTISIGVYPASRVLGQRLLPATTGGPAVDPGLVFEIAAPQPDPSGLAGPGYGIGPANYTRLPVSYADSVLQAPGIVQVTLPPYDALLLWAFDPEEEGTGDFPPRVDDAAVTARLVSWIRVRYPPLPDSAPPAAAAPGAAPAGTGPATMTASTPAAPCLPAGASTSLVLSGDACELPPGRLTWVGVNAATVVQAVPVNNEIVGIGTATPFQSFKVANTPVIVDLPGAIFVVEVLQPDGVTWSPWHRIDDIYAAAPDAECYMLDAASGQITGGSGLFGARWPLGAKVRATYEYGGGLQGQVPVGAITRSTLPGGFSVRNPVATWGADPGESVADGEASISRWLRHRDRLVTIEDFADVTRRTPGVDLGRVEVLPLFNPDGTDPQQQWPGMVSVLVIPRSDPVNPSWPLPDRQFLNAVCAWLEPRRLITTELNVRGPIYRQIWVSVGIETLPGQVPSLVRQQVVAAVERYLSPLLGGLPVDGGGAGAVCSAAEHAGWPLSTDVRSHDIEAVATRVPGVRYVNSVRLAALDPAGTLVTGIDSVPMSGLQLPAATVFVNLGPAEDPASLIGSSQPALPTQVPVPVVPPTC